jgi:hypothetical protein
MGTSPQIVGKRRALSASSILDAIAADLMQIKAEDRLTFADLGRVLGKSDDQAAKYCDGTAEMGMVAYTFARDQWNGRFTGTLDALIGGAASGTPDRSKLSAIIKANLALSLALEDDGEASPAEVREMRRELEAAREAITELLSKLGPKAA